MMDNDSLLRQWHPSYVGCNMVQMPPNWRDQGPVPYTFVFTAEDIGAEAYGRFYATTAKLNLKNPRLFTPSLLQLSSLFHPSFYAAATDPAPQTNPQLRAYLQEMSGLRVDWQVSDALKVATVKFWLQSLLFLTGVTLSAAVIQSRWSIGTLHSKLNRLWQAGVSAERAGLEPIASLQLPDFVRDVAAKIEQSPVQMLLELKKMYGVALKAISEDIPYTEEVMMPVPLTAAQKERFGFVELLHQLLGQEMLAVVLYGSATKSKEFADYDVIVVVKDSTRALEKMAGRSPTYHGLELNLSIYTEADFWIYQLASGDNLMDHGICLYGEVRVPRKFTADLLLRNYSFGFVRLRQLLGMAAYAATVPQIATELDDKQNLFGYFIKIPLNVAKGIQGTMGEVNSNEQIKAWATNEIAYQVEEQRQRCGAGDCAGAIAAAAWATQEVLKWYNQNLSLFHAVPRMEAQLWDELEVGYTESREVINESETCSEGDSVQPG